MKKARAMIMPVIITEISYIADSMPCETIGPVKVARGKIRINDPRYIQAPHFFKLYSPTDPTKFATNKTSDIIPLVVRSDSKSASIHSLSSRGIRSCRNNVDKVTAAIRIIHSRITRI